MILLIDSGNTRTKWRLSDASGPCGEGYELDAGVDSLSKLLKDRTEVSRVAVSMVGSDQSESALRNTLRSLTSAPINFYWAEKTRFGLTNSYDRVEMMGADRWHAMVGAWSRYRDGFAVVDAGSAVTVDYVGQDGCHLGGYILPGLMMMRRSLKIDAARIGFEFDETLNICPGHSTSECTNHGLAWLSSGIVDRIHKDCEKYGLRQLLVTGGDAQRFLSLGLRADHYPGLVFDGLKLIDEAGIDK